MRFTMCSHFFILAAALGVAHLVLPVESLESPSATPNASLLSTPRADSATTTDIASTTVIASSSTWPLDRSIYVLRNRSVHSVVACSDNVRFVLGAVGSRALCGRRTDSTNITVTPTELLDVSSSGHAVIFSVVQSANLTPTIGNQLWWTAVSKHMTIARGACALRDVDACCIDEWASMITIRAASDRSTVFADSQVDDCVAGSCVTVHDTVSHTADNVSSPSFDLLARTTLTLAKLKAIQRANNVFTLYSNLTTVDISVGGELEYTVGRLTWPLSTSHWVDDLNTSAFLPMLFLTATHVPNTNSVPTSCTNPSVNAQLRVITALATAMAFFGFFLMGTGQHFRWWICVLLSSAYWSSALWISWSVSVVGGVLLLLAGVCRGAVLLFGDSSRHNKKPRTVGAAPAHLPPPAAAASVTPPQVR